MTDLAFDIADYAEQVARVLWPDPGAGTLLALPSANRARLLVPAGNRAVAAAAVRRYGVQRDVQARFRAAALAAGLRSGLLQALDRPAARRMRFAAQGGRGGITDVLRGILGSPCEVAVYVGIPRGNRKPVLLAFEPDGTLAAVGKIAVSPLAARLVRNEAVALDTLGQAALHHVITPRVLHAGEWHGLALLVQSALDIPRRPSAGGSKPSQLLEQAEAEISRVGGVSRQRIDPGARDTVVVTLHERIGGLAAGPARSAALSGLQQVCRLAGDIELSVGSWHGDWTPWNHAVTPAGVLAWDWERFARGVPVGYDALHRMSQGEAARTGDPALALRETRRALGTLLKPFAVADDAQELIFALYLIELLVRYTEDVQIRLTAGRRWVQALTAMLADVGAGRARATVRQPIVPPTPQRTAP